MDNFMAFDAQTEIMGRMMIAFLQDRGSFLPRHYLEKYGLVDPQPDQWYPLQAWLTILHELSQADGSLRLADIGMYLVQTAVLPPEFMGLSLLDALCRLHETCEHYTRYGDTGEFIAEQIDNNHLRVTTRLPYPDDYLYGVIYGAAQRFLPPGAALTVTYDPIEPRRKKGGIVTIFHIRWGLAKNVT